VSPFFVQKTPFVPIVCQTISYDAICQDSAWLESFPAYAPELNPDEGIWNYLKNVELKNLCCSDLEELRQEILQAIKRLRQKTHIIKACFQQAGLDL
jgi:transposase